MVSWVGILFGRIFELIVLPPERCETPLHARLGVTFVLSRFGVVLTH